MAASPGSGTSPRVRFGEDELLAAGENGGMVENVLDVLVGEVGEAVVALVVAMGVVVVVNIVGVVGAQG